MRTLINSIIRNANGKNTMIFLLIQLAIYYAFNTWIEPTFETFSNGFTTPDLGRFYKPSFINEVFANTRAEGWHYYLTRFAVVDLFYPAIYAISFGLLIGYVYTKANMPIERISFFVFIPILTAIVDYCENFSIIYLIFTRPAIPGIIALSLSFFTGFKVIGIGISLILILVGLVLWLIRYRQVKELDISSSKTL